MWFIKVHGTTKMNENEGCFCRMSFPCVSQVLGVLTHACVQLRVPYNIYIIKILKSSVLTTFYLDGKLGSEFFWGDPPCPIKLSGAVTVSPADP